MYLNASVRFSHYRFFCCPTILPRQNIILKMKSKNMEDPSKEAEEDVSSQDLIIMISDDEDDVKEVVMEQTTESVDTTLSEDCAQPEEVNSVEQADGMDKGSQGSSFYVSDTLLQFIKRHCCDNVDTSSGLRTTTETLFSTMLSANHPSDIIQACSHAPYCLYLYMGVELGDDQSTSVILVGYVEQSSGVSVVRLLDTLQMSSDTAGPQTSADTVTVIHAAHSDAHLLIEMLKKFSLCLSNLTTFYCNAPHPEGSQVFVSQLQAFSPNLVSFCGLPGMAGRACQSGLLSSFSCVVDLVGDIHHHYSTCPSVDDRMKKIFAHAESYNPSQPISEQCLCIISIVQNMVSDWSDVVKYFKSLGEADSVGHIRSQLMDYKIKLQFLFLFHVLEPLRALQDMQQHGAANVTVELQLISMMIHSYAASILLPSVTERFLRRRDLSFICKKKNLLPSSKVNLGSRATDFLWRSARVDLGNQDRSDFLRAAVNFYKTSLESFVQSVPDQLGDEALMNIGTLLKLPGNNVRSVFYTKCYVIQPACIYVELILGILQY